MGRAFRWTYKLLRAWDQDGFKGAVKAGVDRIVRKGEAQDHEFSRPYRTIRDILFINGCPPEQAPHPYRYRVLHQMEQARAAGYSVSEIFCADVKAETALEANILVFYRCPYSENIGGAIRMAKALNKRVVFDIDDLVIDTAYTEKIPEVRAMNRENRALYDEGVVRYGTTMKMCQAATTTTTRMREEMSRFLSPVYINRNCASEKMVRLSEEALRKRAKQAEEEKDGEGRSGAADGERPADGAAALKNPAEGKPAGKESSALAQRDKQESGGSMPRKEVIIGYFSGSITHNADFQMIQPALERILEERPEVRLLLMGKLDLPEGLRKYEDRILRKPFTDWEGLPEIIAGVDINLAPVENTVFNEAKSENKWVEAALVKVPTVASRMGPFAELIADGVTGFLASDGEWQEVLDRAVRDRALREKVGEQAWRYCREHCVTTQNTARFRQIYEELRAPHAAFVLPSCEMSGGIMVGLRHACFLQDAGWNVDLIVPTAKWPVWTEFGHSFACHSYADGGCDHQEEYDLMVATMWTTVDWIRKYPKVRKRAYLVQNYERDFYGYDDPQRLDSESTYLLPADWQYLTISEWCAGWLRDKYGQQALCMRNGLDRGSYAPVKRDWNGRKIRILIEGDCAVDYKNVDESFRIAERLDPEKYEIWYMSYNAEPKEGYRVDKFLHAVPYGETPEVYRSCDILVKSSWLESFSYPPLEMMATGGYCVAVPNGGNAEYLRDGENCLLYPLGDEDAAVRAIERIAGDPALRELLRENGLKTAEARDWGLLREEILRTYRETAIRDYKMIIR